MSGLDASLILLFFGFGWLCTLVVIHHLYNRVSSLEAERIATYETDRELAALRAKERHEETRRWKETNERLENLENRRFVIVSKPTPDGVKFELEEREKVEGGYWHYSEDDSDEEAEEVDGEEEETDDEEEKADDEEEKHIEGWHWYLE